MNQAMMLAQMMVQQSRSHQEQRAIAQADRMAMRQTYAVRYLPPHRGQHQGRLPNGGKLPIAPASNGALKRDQLYLAVRGRGAVQAHGIWMPR